jgi:hypothetical protein
VRVRSGGQPVGARETTTRPPPRAKDLAAGDLSPIALVPAYHSRHARAGLSRGHAGGDYTQSWAQREHQIEKTRANLTGMVADLVRIGAELPPTALAELPATDLAVLPQPAVPALPSVPD